MYNIVRKRTWGYIYTVDDTVYFSRGDGTELWVKCGHETVTSGITKDATLHLDLIQPRPEHRESIIRLTRHGDIMSRRVYYDLYDDTGTEKYPSDENMAMDNTKSWVVYPVMHTVVKPVPRYLWYDYGTSDNPKIKFAVTIYGLSQT